MTDGITNFTTEHPPFHLKGRGWVYTVIYLGEPLQDKRAYVTQLLRDGCMLNGKHVMPIGIESFAILGLAKGMGIGILLKERVAG